VGGGVLLFSFRLKWAAAFSFASAFTEEAERCMHGAIYGQMAGFGGSMAAVAQEENHAWLEGSR